MKHPTITDIPEQGRPTRCFKVELNQDGNNYTLYTSNIGLIEKVRANDKQATKRLERLTQTNERQEQRKRILIPILAVIILYLCSYTKECNTLQNWGYLVGLMALIGLGIIIYKYSK